MSVPRQGVEPCSLRTKRRTPARWGNLAQGRVLTSLSRAAATAVAEKRGEPHGGPRKPLKLYNYNLKKMCARACSGVNAYMAAASHSQRAGFPRPQTQTSICGGGYRSGFRVPAAKRCITCFGKDNSELLTLMSVIIRPLPLSPRQRAKRLFFPLIIVPRSQ